MAKVASALKSISFRYDFAVDGGTIGSKRTGAYLPKGAEIIGSVVLVETDANCAAGNSVINIGVSGATDFIIENGMALQGGYQDYILSSYGFLIQTQGGNSPGLFPPQASSEAISVPLAASKEILVTIVTEALTAGKFVVTVLYVEFE